MAIQIVDYKRAAIETSASFSQEAGTLKLMSLIPDATWANRHSLFSALGCARLQPKNDGEWAPLDPKTLCKRLVCRRRGTRLAHERHLFRNIVPICRVPTKLVLRRHLRSYDSLRFQSLFRSVVVFLILLPKMLLINLAINFPCFLIPAKSLTKC